MPDLRTEHARNLLIDIRITNPIECVRNCSTAIVCKIVAVVLKGSIHCTQRVKSSYSKGLVVLRELSLRTQSVDSCLLKSCNSKGLVTVLKWLSCIHRIESSYSVDCHRTQRVEPSCPGCFMVLRGVEPLHSWGWVVILTGLDEHSRGIKSLVSKGLYNGAYWVKFSCSSS